MNMWHVLAVYQGLVGWVFLCFDELESFFDYKYMSLDFWIKWCNLLCVAALRPTLSISLYKNLSQNVIND